jgi:hypothetical protein
MPVRYARKVAAGLAAAAVLLLPATSAAAVTKPHPRFTVSALGLVGHTRVYDVADAPAVARVRVQVKDHDKTVDPTSVVLTVVEQVSGEPGNTTAVAATRVGSSRVVTNWHAAITLAQGAVAPGTTATYCLRLVTAAAPGTAVVTATARGLAGRDCFAVTNTGPVV